MSDDNRFDAGRRKMLARLGLALTGAYVAPAVMQLGKARASSFSRPSAPVRRQAPRRAVAPAPPPEIVVATVDPAGIDLIAAQGYQLLSRSALSLLGVELARFSVPPPLTLEEARAQITGLLPEALFDLNHIYRPGELACGTDSCAAFDMIGWTSAAHRCTTRTVIGIVDTTVNEAHEALEGVDIQSFPVIADGREAGSAIHGTAIAILVAGRSDTRTPGLLDGARVIAAEAFHRDASGQDVADSFDIARAISELSERGVGVLNLSFAGPDNAILARVVEAAIEQGIILVAAAGNEGPAADPLFPAAYENVVAVTAVDVRKRVFRQANQGDHIDFAAPGVRIWTAASISGGRFRSGTSYAAPFVSAMLAVARTQHPDDDVPQLVEKLADGAIDLGEPGRDATFGWGLIQAPAACDTPAEEFFPAAMRQ